MKAKPTSFMSKLMFFIIAALLMPQVLKGQVGKRDMELHPSEVVRQLPNSVKRFALIIGVDQYEDAQISKLDGASNDAKSLADALIRNAGFPAGQVVLLTSDQPMGRRPTRANILRRLSNLRGAVPQDGLLLVAFAGHGMERGGKAYFLPTDAQVNGDVSLLEDTAISLESLRELIRQTGVGQVIVILDACRNDPESARGDEDNRLSAAYTRGFDFDLRNRDVIAFATIYATEIGYRAYEYKGRKQGYFTLALVEGLKGGAANSRGEVTLAGLVKYLQDVVPRRVSFDLGPTRKQRPFAVIEGYKAEELVIALGKLPPIMYADKSGLDNTTDVLGLKGVDQQPDVLRDSDRKKGLNSKRVLILAREINREAITENGAILILSKRIIENGFAVVTNSDLSNSDQIRFHKLIQRLESGDKKAAVSIPFAVVITCEISFSAIDLYQGMYIAFTRGALKAIETATGETIAIENVSDIRGFGNNQDQAMRNALKNAGQGISELFINRVSASAR